MNGEFEGAWDIDGVRLALKLARPFSLTKVLFIAGLLATAALTLTVLLTDDVTLLVVIVAALVVVAGVFFWVTLWQLPRQLLDGAAFRGVIRGSYSDAGMTVASDVATTEYLWSGFNGVKHHDDAVGFTYATRATLTILRRWFPSDEAWRSFLSVAELGITQSTADTSAGMTAATPPAVAPAAPPSPDISGTVEPTTIGFQGTWDETAIKSAIGAIAPAGWLRRFVGPWLIALLLLFRLSASSEGEGPGLRSVLPILIAMALGALFYFGLPHLYGRQMRKNVGGETVEGIASTQGLQMKSEGAGATANHWSTYTKAVVTGDAVALRFSAAPVPATALPRSWFANDDEWEYFVALVRQHVRS